MMPFPNPGLLTTLFLPPAAEILLAFLALMGLLAGRFFQPG
jgi:hypothetical protein